MNSHLLSHSRVNYESRTGLSIRVGREEKSAHLESGLINDPLRGPLVTSAAASGDPDHLWKAAFILNHSRSEKY